MLSPLLGCFFTFLKRKGLNRRFFYALVLALPIFNISALLYLGAYEQAILVGPFFCFSLDRFSLFFCLLVNLALFLTTIYTSGYLRYNFEAKRYHFHFFLFLATATSIATGVAGNLATVFFFYLLSIPCVAPLILLRGTERSLYVAKVYWRTVLTPPLVLLFLLLVLTPDLRFFLMPFQELAITKLGFNHWQASLLLVLLILGFSKNSVAPFHFWLPMTSLAPAPVSALIHTAGIIQAPVLVLLKVCRYIYGHDYLIFLNTEFFYTGWLLYLCGGTALYAAYRAYRTQDIKERFSFSTVSQLSYIISAVLLGSKQAMIGAELHMISHAVAKMNLFFIAGIFATLCNASKTFELARFAPHYRPLIFAFGVSGLSIAGVPLFAGFLSKDMILLEGVHQNHYAVAVFLLVGSFINILYIYPILKAGLFGKKIEGYTARVIPWSMKLAVLACLLLTLTFSQYVNRLIEIFAP